MNFLIDISKELEDLKRAFTCSKCKAILKQPVVFTTCQHSVCKHCSDVRKLNCPICKKTCDSKDDIFTSTVLKGIENIDKIFAKSKAAVPKTATEWYNDEEFKIQLTATAMKRNPKGETPLHLACKKKLRDKVEELLQKGVDINMTDYANWTSLHEAVQSQSYECVELLLENGALIDVPGEFYITPLYKAATLNFVSIVKLLLKYGANVHLKDYTGRSVLDCALSKEMTDVLRNTKKEIDILPNVYLSANVVVYSTDIISKDNRDKMTKIKVKFATLHDFINKNDVTHLVLGQISKLSANVLIAILKGIFIVDEQWIEAFIETENKISFDYIPDIYRKVLNKSIRNRLKQQPKLFDGIAFYIIDHEKPTKIYNMELMKKDLSTLIECAGGKVVLRPPALRTVENCIFFPYHADKGSDLSMCCNYIIYNETDPPQLLYKMKELKHKSSKWLIDCILNFNLIT